jgi:hypothetical protein
MTDWIKAFNEQNSVPDKCSVMHMYVYETINSTTFDIPVIKWMCASITKSIIQDPVVDTLDSYSDSHSVDLVVDTLELVLYSQHDVVKKLLARVVRQLLKRGYIPTYESLILLISYPTHDQIVLTLIPSIANRLKFYLNTPIIQVWVKHVEHDIKTNYNRECVILNLYKHFKYSVNIPIDEKGNTLLHWIVHLQKQDLPRKYRKWTNSVVKYLLRYGGHMDYLNYEKVSSNMIKSGREM